MGRISLSQTYGEDAAEMKAALELFSSPGMRDAEITDIGRRLRDEGIAKSVKNADAHWSGWSDMALQSVMEFARQHSGRFQAEDVRNWSRGVPPAPSLRAWGAVMLKAARMGIIKNTGETKQVRNPLAHNANASVWVAA